MALGSGEPALIVDGQGTYVVPSSLVLEAGSSATPPRHVLDRLTGRRTDRALGRSRTGQRASGSLFTGAALMDGTGHLVTGHTLGAV
jgi:hypothetical protein